MAAIEAVIAKYPQAWLAHPWLEREPDSAIQELEKLTKIFTESKEQITTEKVDRKKTREYARPGTQYSFNPNGHFGEYCGARNTEKAANAICTQVVHRNTLEDAGALCRATVCEWQNGRWRAGKLERQGAHSRHRLFARRFILGIPNNLPS